MSDKTLGAYKRTTPDPDETTGEALARLQAEMTRLLDEADAELRDEADGGVAAALIEKDAEKPTAADFATAEFARHAESGGVGMRKDAGDPNTWCVAYENPGWRVGIRSDIEMARDGWAPVRECPDPEQHCDIDPAPIIDEVARLDGELHDMRTRAVKAEQERDEAREARTVYLPGPPRPLSPDAITTTFAAMVAKMLSDRGHGWVPSHYLCESMRGAAAALTEPPARPEWINAPAVRAWHKHDGRTEHDGTPGKPRIWSPDYGTTETWSTPSLRSVPWSDLVDVEPLGITEDGAA